MSAGPNDHVGCDMTRNAAELDRQQMETLNAGQENLRAKAEPKRPSKERMNGFDTPRVFYVRTPDG
jgi:hypothetical protein